MEWVVLVNMAVASIGTRTPRNVFLDFQGADSDQQFITSSFGDMPWVQKIRRSS